MENLNTESNATNDNTQKITKKTFVKRPPNFRNAYKNNDKPAQNKNNERIANNERIVQNKNERITQNKENKFEQRVNTEQVTNVNRFERKGLPHFNNKNLQVMFFGGVGKVGDNITALKYGEDILVVDCGVGFAEPEMLGIDLVIPDMSWLKVNKDKIRGIAITHAHEDHIGSLPFFLDEVKAPVYGSKLTIAMIENKLREYPKVKMKGVTVNPGNVVKIGCFTVEFIHVNHSIPGAFALAITTPVGIVYVSGDFKIDFTPISGETTDLARIGELGRKGVLLMLCESTNIERPGMTMSESVVGQTLSEIFEESKNNRIIVTSFASNVHRVQQIMDLAKKYNRKVAFAGRSMINNMELAMKIGEIKFDHKLIVDIDHVGRFKDNEIMVLATGSQGQEHTALDRMVNGEFNGLQIGTNDTIIFSSSPVPGNEKSVTNIINGLMLKGAKVIYDDLSDVHASGHACQTEFMIIHKLIKPKFFMPMHGEVKHLMYHRDFAIKMGIKPVNIIVPHVGSVIEIGPHSMKQLKDIRAGEKIVDGKTISDVDSSVLRDRLQLAEDGICVVVVGLDKRTGNVIKGPELIPRGFIYATEMSDMITEAKQVVMTALGSTGTEKIDVAEMKSIIRRTLTNLFYKRTKRKPLVIPVLLEL